MLVMLVFTGCSGKKTEQLPTQAATEPTEELGALITLPAAESKPATPVAPAVTETVPPATSAATAPAEIVITKHPSSETVSQGDRKSVV